MLFSTRELTSQQSKNLTTAIRKGKLLTKAQTMYEDTLVKIPYALEQGHYIEFVSDGSWSTHQLVETIIKKTGPVDLILTTWAMTEKPLRSLTRLKQKGQITNLQGLVDKKIKHHNPKAWGMMQMVFDSITPVSCHAKVTLLKNEDWQMSILSSANWTVNRRLEAGTINCTPESYEFHHKWISQHV